jgi:hypothetical protein
MEAVTPAIGANLDIGFPFFSISSFHTGTEAGPDDLVH